MADQTHEAKKCIPWRRAICSVSCGEVHLMFPDALTWEDIADLEAFFALQFRTLRRVAERREVPGE